MRKITVARPQVVEMLLAKGRILIDGKDRETVKGGKTVVFEIPDGKHEIQMILESFPKVKTNILPIEESDGDVVFEVKIKESMIFYYETPKATLIRK